MPEPYEHDHVSNMTHGYSNPADDPHRHDRPRDGYLYGRSKRDGLHFHSNPLPPPHRPVPNADKTHCTICGRGIVKGERRPSGLYWRHVK